MERLKRNSKLKNVNPFIDNKGLLRVGGRLTNSVLSYDQKHSIILSNKHKLTHLTVTHEHIKNLHVGIQNLLSIITLKYWLINGKNVIKSVTRSCIRCARLKAKPANFLVGLRVIPCRPFSKCGEDYAGPVFVKDNTLRKFKLVKTYICIFVCFNFRAVHIELVKDLTTDSFLNALKRFISRHGKPTDIFSDNGLNFIGANNHFIKLHNLISDKNHNERVTQIEACLNSRPLTPLSTDPNDYLPLTPFHFLIGDSLATAPQQDVQTVDI